MAKKEKTMAKKEKIMAKKEKIICKECKYFDGEICRHKSNTTIYINKWTKYALIW